MNDDPLAQKHDAKSNESSQTISDIIRGMQYAVNTAQETLQKHQFELLEQYFDADGKPYTRFIVLPDGRQVDIPVITLIPANMLAIDELEMDFAVRVASSFVKKYEGKEGEQLEGFDTSDERSSFSVFFSGVSKSGKAKSEKKRGLFGKQKDSPVESITECFDDDTDVIRIKMKFKSIEEPEAAARIREMLYTQVQ